MRPSMQLRVQELHSILKARGAEIISAESLAQKLGSGRRLRIKLGIDPTTPHLHLGHMVPLRMLRAFQDAGYRAVLIIGDFTGQIGDPAGAATARRQLSPAEVKRNERTYLSQAGKVLDLRTAEVHHNSEWYGTMRARAFLDLLTRFSLKSAWQREDFQKRLQSGKEVCLHEATYHVLQAYDSVAVRADVEIGGVDQKLNLLAGRELQPAFRQSPQDIVLVPYLIGPDGVQKMSKSAGNTINLRDTAADMFGKVMSIPDTLIAGYAELAAWLPPDRVREIGRDLKGGGNPRDLKLEVAEAVTAFYHGSRRAKAARQAFLEVFSQRSVPRSAPAVRFPRHAVTPLQLLEALPLKLSKSEARRLLAGGAVEVDGTVLRLGNRAVAVKPGSAIRIGKKRFFRTR